MCSAVIDAEGLSFSYTPKATVLDDLSLVVREGERVGIVGANGAGKSTLLLLLAGAAFPTAGRLTIHGVTSSTRTAAEIRRHTGLVFQNPEDMLFMATARADVAFGPRSRGLDEKSVESRVEAALATTGSSRLADRPPWELSDGEKRAVSIAAVLALEPTLLLCDEPSAGLDPVSRRELIRLLPSVPGTLVVASHDLDMILDVCDRVVILGDGRVAADGSVQDILRDEVLLKKHRLELPLRLQACPLCGSVGSAIVGS